MSLNETLSKIPSPIKWIVGTGLVCLLFLVLWLWATKGVNGISNFFFWRQANAKLAKVNADLEDSKKKQAIIDQTLKDLAASEQRVAEAEKARIEAERIFKDATKTAKEKVAAYEAAMRDNPVHTDPAGVTTDDLCARAKTANSNPDLIRALCQE